MQVKKLAVLAAVLVAALLSAESALACSCAPPGTPQESLASSDAVFTGTVLSLTPGQGTQEVRLRVEGTWKGAKCGEVTGVTALDEAACGFGFQEGTSYLVYATKNQGKLSTNLCTRTKPTASASEDLAALGAPKKAC